MPEERTGEMQARLLALKQWADDEARASKMWAYQALHIEREIIAALGATSPARSSDSPKRRPDCAFGDCADHYGDPLAWCGKCAEARSSVSEPPPEEWDDGNTWHPSHRLGVLGCNACGCGGRHEAHALPCQAAAVSESPVSPKESL